MPLIDAFYEWLEHAPSESADLVLAAGLEHAEPECLERITSILLKRCNETSLGGLIGAIDRLPPDTRSRVLSETARVPGGIAVAMRSASVRTRLNAMAALESVPTPRLSYLLTYALRDGAGAVRDAAVRAGRMIGEVFLDRTPPRPDEGDGTAFREYGIERRQLVQALREIARTYDRHFRLELLEVCLWFADDLEADLWVLLENPRSNSGRAVQDHLQLWNGPRMAAFLLQCLKRSEWRRPAQLLLSGWHTLDSVTALLRQTPLLDDEEIRRGLAGVNRPRWFNDCAPDLSRLPADVRPHAPRWIASAGIAVEHKVQTLSTWLRSSSDELRRAAVYAIAALEAPEARRALRSCSGGATSIGQFARWVLASHTQEPLTAKIRSQAGVLAPPPARDDAGSDAFDLLWRACRAATGGVQSELLAVLQEHAELIERPLRAALNSAEPRERLLAIRVVGTQQNAGLFARELDALRTDPVSAIRGLSQTVLKSIAAMRGGGSAPEPDRTSFEPEKSRFAASIERRLGEILNDGDELTPERVREIDAALRAGGDDSPAIAGAATTTGDGK